MTLTESNSLHLARLALPQFGFDPDDVQLTFIKMRENTVFRADTPDGPIALRLHRPGYRSLEEVQAESAFIEILADRGFPVVRLVPTTAGTYTAVVTDGQLEVVVDAQRWLEDAQQLGDTEADPHAEIDAAIFEAMGGIAARMHDVAEDLVGTHRFHRAPWDAEGLVGERALWGDALTVPGLTDDDRAQLLRARQLIMAELQKFGTAPQVYGTIHADFTPENVLVSGNDLVVIDFDDFGDGWYLFDLATVLFWYLRHPDFAQLRSALLRGYRAERQLSETDERMLDVLLVARGYTYLGWAATRPETPTAQFLIDEIVPFVVQLAGQLEADLS